MAKALFFPLEFHYGFSSFEEQITFKDIHPSIFLRQMEAIGSFVIGWGAYNVATCSIAFENKFLNPLYTDKLRINATFMPANGLFWPFSSQFRPGPQEKCFLTWTVTVSFGFRTFSSILSWGMRT